MAIGDQADMAARLRRALPRGWFPDDAPALGTILAGFGSMWSGIFDHVAYVTLQTRIATATGANLDLIALDFFGMGLQRRPGESDDLLRARIKRELFREKGTRAAIVSVLTDLTGVAPAIFEPRRTSDTGGWTQGGIGFGVAGGYGSLTLPFQAFVTAYRATPSGIANVEGFYPGSGAALGGWGQGAIMWGSLAQVAGPVTDADVYAAVAGVIPEATIAWTAIGNAPTLPNPPGAPLGLTPGAVPDGSTGKLALAWSAPASGGTPTGYTVLQRPHAGGAWAIVATVTATSATLTGLTGGTAYDVAVIAANAAGPGPMSAVVTGTPYSSTFAFSTEPNPVTHGASGIAYVVTASPNPNGAAGEGIDFSWSSSASVNTRTGGVLTADNAGGYPFNGNSWGQYLTAPSAPGTWFVWAVARDGTGGIASAPITVT